MAFFVAGTENLDELVSAVMQRIGLDADTNKLRLLVSSCFSYM